MQDFYDKSTRVTFSELFTAYERRKAKAQREEGERGGYYGPDDWKTSSGAFLTTASTTTMVIAEANRAVFGYKEANDRWTLHCVFLDDTMAMVIVGEVGQFMRQKDAEEIAKEVAGARMDTDLLSRAHNAGKGEVAGEVKYYKRNQGRAASITKYRERMKQRVIPLKGEAAWAMLVGLIDDGEFNAPMLQLLVDYAKDKEAAESGNEESIFDGLKAMREFVKNHNPAPVDDRDA